MKGVLICSSPTTPSGSSLPASSAIRNLTLRGTAANGSAESVLLFWHQKEIRTASLGQAVDVGKAGLWEEVTYLPAQCRAERLASAQNPVELSAGGQLLVNGAVERQKFAQHCWHKRCVCDVLLGEHFKDGERFKTRLQQYAAALQ